MSIRSFLHNLFFETRKFVSLQAFQSTDYAVSDLLLFSRFVDESVILNTDGSFTTFFWYRGEDLDSSTDEVLNFLSEIINKSTLQLGTGWAMHLDCDCKESSGYIPEDKSYFNDATTNAMDHERRIEYNKAGSHFENEYVLSFTYLPPKDITSKAGAFFLNDDGSGKKHKVDYTQHLDKFIETVLTVIDLLTSAHFKVWRMTDSEIESYLFYCINGIRATLNLPTRHWTDLRFILANQDVTTGFYPMVGEKHMRVISMGEQFPMETYPTLLDSLNKLGFEYRWSTRYIFLDPRDAKKMMKKIADLHYQQRESASQIIGRTQGFDSGKVNRSAIRYADDAEEAIASIESGGIRFGKYTSCIVIFDEDEERIKEKVKIVEAAINNCGLYGKVEKAQVFDAYLGSIPGMVRPNVRKWIMHSYNLADLMPTTSIWSGYKKHPCEYYAKAGQDQVLFYASTAGGTPFRGCLHYGNNGNTLVIGDNVGYVMNFLSAQQKRYKNSQIYVFDSGHSSLPICYATNGTHYDIGYGDEGESITFKPLANLDNQEDFTFAVQWLTELCIVNGYDIKPKHTLKIVEVLEIIKKEALPEQRTMDYFVYQLQSRDEELTEQFKPYTSSKGSSLQNILFDSKVDHLKLSDFTVFEIGQLIKKGDQLLVPTIRYLFHMISRNLNGSPVSIYLHDGYAVLKHPVFSSFLDDLLRNMSNSNVQLIIGVTNPGDILNSNLSSILLQNCPTKIFTSNQTASTQQKPTYEAMGLNERQISLISHALPNREYYFSNPLGNRLINFSIGELTKLFISVPSIEVVEKIRKLKKERGEYFGYFWILENNLLEEYADYWMAMHEKLINEKGISNE